MQVQQLPIYQFLEGSGKSFVVPVYQRDYAWTTANCKKLFEDLMDLKNHGRADHFLGTLVTISDGFDEYTIIDGQQRLTTVSILLVALRNYLEAKENQAEEERTLQGQISDFLINRHSPEDKRIRLKPNKQDKAHFDSLFKQKDLGGVSSNIVSNYNFFYGKIQSRILSPKEMFDLFKKLKIVLINLDRGQDNPQLIFESLNSTGVSLTAGDLIRNYILMDLEPREQERMYNDYWLDIEKYTGDVAEFVRAYLTFKTKSNVVRKNVYDDFKKESSEKFGNDREGILQDLLYFAEIYSWLVQITAHANDKINERLKRLNQIEFTVTYPYLLDVFNDLKENVFSEDIVAQILATIESFAFRKTFVEGTTQGSNKMFAGLSDEIKRESSWKTEYLAIFHFILLGKRVSQRFPTDEEFKNALITKEVYRLQARNKNFLLASLENYGSAYRVEVDELTIDHIMPQTLTPAWQRRLGDNWEEIHEKYLHTLGNLSLTARNSELSNRDFDERQVIDYQTSRLRLNYRIEGDTWGENDILERAKYWAGKALNVWAYPKTAYSKPQPKEQVFDLTSEDDFTGTKPSSLRFENEGRTVKIKTWNDLQEEVCKFLCEYSPTQFSAIHNSQEFKKYFSNTEKSLKQPKEFVSGKFVEGNTPATRMVKFLREICERMDYDSENISFVIKDTTKQ